MLLLHTNGSSRGEHGSCLLGSRGRLSVHGVEAVSLVHLEAGGLMVVGGGPRKGKKLPSLLEGEAFQSGAMVE